MLPRTLEHESHTAGRIKLKLLMVWFLVIDEKLHAFPLLRDLAAMCRKGHEVTCIVPIVRRVPESVEPGLKIDAVRLHYSIPVFSYLLFCTRALRLLHRHVRLADVVIAGADEVPLIVPWLLQRKMRGKSTPRFAVRVLSPIVESRSTHRYYQHVLRYVSMMLARYADVVFAISPMHANDISSAYGIRHDRIQVWPSTVDLSLFDPSMYRADRRDVRSELGFEDMFTLMYHGVLTAERGLDELVQAVKMANDEGYRVGLLLLGKGSSEQQLRSLIASLDLSDNVRLHASVPYDQVPRFIAACDAGAIPLPDQEQWRYQAPTKLLEYLAMQKAVIATEIPAHRWLMRGYEQAFYCGKGHQSEIKAAIVRCINARSVRQHPDQHAADQFSSETVADKVVVALSSK